MNNLTQLAVPRLSETFNLTDGHIHRHWDKRERRIIDHAGAIFLEASREMQPQLEEAFIEAFFRLGKQTADHTKTRYLLSNSASANLEIVANYLRLKKMSVALIEPCFDNLADIFRRHNIKLIPIPEKYLIDKTVDNFLKNLEADTLCIVSPNNPTGLFYTRENLRKIATYCKKNDKLLIIDASFGLYNTKENMFDEYALLNSIGVDYVCVEDTGKTWPTHDIKISILACTPSLYGSLYRIHSDFILHVSPFALKLLTEFFKNSDKDKLHRIREVISMNRKSLYEAIQGTVLKPVEKLYSSVAWLEITNNLSALQLKKILDAQGVFILPGNHFFWSNPRKGRKFIRVALTRDPGKYKEAMKKLKIILKRV